MAASCEIEGKPTPPNSILELRHLLAERFPQPPTVPPTRVATGLATLDEATEGGLPKGAITELTSSQFSAGTASLIHSLLQHAQQSQSFLALIDGRDSFDPVSASTHDESCLRHLLWVRCSKTIEAVKAADLLLRDGNFPIVVLDLVLNAPAELRKIPQTSWYRLQRLVEPSPTAFLVLTRCNTISSAQLKLVLQNEWKLRDLQRDAGDMRLRFQVHRRQGGRLEMTGTG
ncbi:MAG: hypothetical protein ABI883_02125 [Chthoniobacterales bacterium]